MSIGSAAFTVTSSFDNAQIQASVDRLNATVAASIKDARIGSELDQAKLDATLKAATVKIARTQANVKLGADMQTAQIDATIAKAKADILAQSETIGSDSGKEMQSGFEGFMSPQVLIPAITAATALLPGLFAVAGSAGAIALGAAFAVKASPELQKQGAALVSGLETTVEQAASTLDKPIEGAFTQMEGELPTLQRLLSTTFSAVGPEIKPFTTMLTEIVNDTLPGFNSLMQQSQGPLSQFFAQSGKIIGTGLGKFFANLGPGVTGSLDALEEVESVTVGVADDFAKAASAIGLFVQGAKKLDDTSASIDKALGDKNSTSSWTSDLGNIFSWVMKLNSFTAGASKNGTLSAFMNNAGSSIKTAGDNAAGAAPKFQTAITPVQQLGADLSTAATDTTKLDTAWNSLVGNFTGEQQGIVAAKQAVDNYAQAVKQSGASSLQAQSAFYATAQSLGQMVDAEVKNHAPASQIYSDLESQISALKSKGPLNSSEKQDLGDLQKAADGVATSTSGLSTQILNLAGVSEDNLLPQLTALHTKGTTLNTDMTGLAASILNTGAQSSATASARAKLISDLEQSGVNASTAQGDVTAFQKSIDALHGKTVPIGADVAGAEAGVKTFTQLVDAIPKSVAVTLTTQVSGANLNQIATALTGMAAGGIVGAAGGMIVPGTSSSVTRDNHLIAVKSGELIIPSQHAPKFADMARKASIPGFAGGGGYVNEPVFRVGTMPYSFAETAPVATVTAATVPAGGLPMTRTQGTALLQKLDRLIRQGAQAPYTQAQALREAAGAGVRRGYFATAGLQGR